MRELYQIWRVCLYHYSRWRGNWRVILSFGLGGVISFLLTENVVRFSQEYGLTMQIFEPFIWVFGDGTSILLVALAIILLFGDMPFLDGSVPYYLIRIRMRVWVGGQMIYLITSSLLYTFFILVMTMVFCFQNAFVGNMWSPNGGKTAYSGLADDYFIPAQLKTFEMVRPVECMITIFVPYAFIHPCGCFCYVSGNTGEKSGCGHRGGFYISFIRIPFKCRRAGSGF